MNNKKIDEKEMNKVNGGAGRYDVVYEGEAWLDKLDLYIVKQTCWFAMTKSRCVLCDHYRREGNEWLYMGESEVTRSTLFDYEYKGYWKF